MSRFRAEFAGSVARLYAREASPRAMPSYAVSAESVVEAMRSEEGRSQLAFTLTGTRQNVDLVRAILDSLREDPGFEAWLVHSL